ncbi:M15 family metallopeptidase [Planctobacterium marinum]|uniref:Peptidase M15 n=1 Tax=Planctobacterium marinum TaxID=1631968 RepID=A0AA48KSA6_9ALTE|nr:peptidase M15 [Planctobacterium marinum]
MQLLNHLPLVTIDGKHQLHEAVVTDFLKLQQAAGKAGVSLDIASSYRSVERQLTIWNEKWDGLRPVLDRDGNQCDIALLDDQQKLQTILIWSALPGSSRHHWGTDVDVYDAPAIQDSAAALQLVPQEYESTGPCGRLKRWMDAHLEDYGFYCPFTGRADGVAFEPWHISHKAQASIFQSALTPSAMSELINSLEIHGKEIILQNLDWIYTRFMVN